MDEQRQQLIDRIKQAQNILVTVSSNPSVDQLSAAIGLTIALNKLDKHGTAVFSGQVPSTLEFLKPDETLEKNTDSLRDFIIALDKSKADKLRYKVEDNVVRIFITPYRTSLSDKDLEFSQGDFNVDVVVCLGVTEQQDLDTAITSHGRILHDATVVSVSTQGQGSLGSINWVDPTASSLSEMIVGLADGLDKKLLDNQIATALLTGIVSTTDRFRNEKTSPKTMSAAAELMAAGANQQLIASELETASKSGSTPPGEGDGQAPQNDRPQSEPPKKSEPGTLEIDHEANAEEAPEELAPEPPQPQVHVDEDGHLMTDGEPPQPQISEVKGIDAEGKPSESREIKRERIVEPPKLGDADLTANTAPEPLDPSTEELSLPPVDAPLLSHNENVLPPPPVPEPPRPEDTFIPQAPLQPAPPAWQPAPMPAPAPFTPPAPTPAPIPEPTTPPPITDDETLTEIEQAVDSPHVQAQVDAAASVDDARNAVEAALQSAAASNPLEPVAALNAQPLGPELHDQVVPAPFTPLAPTPIPNMGFSEPTPGNSPADETLDMPLPSSPFGPGRPGGQPDMPGQQAAPQNPLMPPPAAPPSAFPGAPQQGGGTPPPPVPPPMLPPLQ